MDASDRYLEDGLCTLVGGAVGAFNLGGWLLPYLHLLPLDKTLWLCLASGAVIALFTMSDKTMKDETIS